MKKSPRLTKSLIASNPCSDIWLFNQGEKLDENRSIINVAAKQLHQTVGRLETRPVASNALVLSDMALYCYAPQVSNTQRCSAVS